MPKAARIGDPCMHPSARLSTGSPDTIIGSRPASRHFDHSLGCTVPIPVPPHIGGTLMKCSTKVFINFLPAARVGDLLMCPMPGPVGPPGGPKHFATQYNVHSDDDAVKLLYVRTRNGDWDKDQSRAQVDPGTVQGDHDYDVPLEGKPPPKKPLPKPANPVGGSSGNPIGPSGGGASASASGMAAGSSQSSGSPSASSSSVGVSTPSAAPASSSSPPPGGGGAAAYYDIKSKLLSVSDVADANEKILFHFDVMFGFRMHLPIWLGGPDRVVDGCSTVFIGG